MDGSVVEQEIKEWDFKSETCHDGTTKVALRQPVPLQFSEFIRNNLLIVRMFQASGHPTVKSIEIHDKVSGGYSKENRSATVTREDGSKFKVFIKGSED